MYCLFLEEINISDVKIRVLFQSAESIIFKTSTKSKEKDI